MRTAIADPFLHLFADTLYTSVARSKVGDWLDVALLGGAAARSRHRHRRIQPDSHADAARNDLPAPARIRGPANHVVQSRGIDELRSKQTPRTSCLSSVNDPALGVIDALSR